VTEITLSWIALVLYAVTLIVYLVALLQRRRGDSLPGFILLGLSVLVHLAAVIWRGRIAGHLPFASRFEALLFYGLATAVLVLVIGRLRRNVPVAFLTLPIVMVFMLGALLGGEKTPRPLPPILNSPFFLIHVVVAFLGYGFYTVNAGLAVGALVQAPSIKPQASSKMEYGTRMADSEVLIGLARQLVPWGLLLLGSGIGLGAVWAMYSWGNWWGWDPKENAALVTWLGYLVYTHSPFWNRRPGRWDAVFLIAGYILLIAAFLGVNLLRRGLHAYQ